MIRLSIIISFLLISTLSFSQQRTKIILQESLRATYIQNGEIAFLKNPVFRHDNAILKCDSAVLYGGDKNYFEAFGKVHINQADTVNIYSDFLTYDGNSKLAHATKNVKLVHREAVLTTDFLDYSMAPKIGRYWNNGKIVNKDITINSKTGFYFANSRDAYFRYNVKAVTEQSVITSDTLRYNTLSNWAYFYGPTNIKGKDDNMYTENGVYNTKSGNAIFGKNNLYTNGSRSLTGDSLYYDGAKQYGKAVKNIVFRDTVDRALLRGNLGEYYKKEERVVVTNGAYVGLGTEDSIMVNNLKIPDTLWIGADTLETTMMLKKNIPPIPIKTAVVVASEDNEKGDASNKEAMVSSAVPVSVQNIKPLVRKDSVVKEIVVKDTLNKVVSSTDTLSTDTLKSRVINAFYNVKVFKSNLQARADSLFYADADSTLRWYKNPIMWAENSQQTGDTIYLEMKNKKLHRSEVLGNGFIVNLEGDSINFNQLKGTRIIGKFEDGNIKNMEVIGNAESIYFNRKDSVVTDMHQSFAGIILFEFENRELQGVRWKNQSESKLTPFAELSDSKYLTGFIWKPELRLLSKEQVIMPSKKGAKEAVKKDNKEMLPEKKLQKAVPVKQ